MKRSRAPTGDGPPRHARQAKILLSIASKAFPFSWSLLKIARAADGGLDSIPGVGGIVTTDFFGWYEWPPAVVVLQGGRDGRYEA